MRVSSRTRNENVGDKSKEKYVDNGGAALGVWVSSLKPNAVESGILMTRFKAEEENTKTTEKQLKSSMKNEQKESEPRRKMKRQQPSVEMQTESHATS